MIEYTLFINNILVLSVNLPSIGDAKKGPCELYFSGCCPNTQWDSRMKVCIDPSIVKNDRLLTSSSGIGGICSSSNGCFSRVSKSRFSSIHDNLIRVMTIIGQLSDGTPGFLCYIIFEFCSNFNGCCPNTQWDSAMEMCVDCPSGYVWINCSKPCQYPYYGPKCDQKCSCEKDNCDHTIGCKSNNGISEVSSATIFDIYDTDADSSTPHSVATVSTDAADNTLHIILVIVSIIVGVIIVAYVSVVVVENIIFNKSR